jgi:CrcB protein
LIEQAEYLKAVMNMVISVIACVMACWVGLVLGRQI